MKPTCEIFIRFTYGVERIYPANDIALELVALTGKTTFNRDDIKRIARLGYEVKIIPDPRSPTL